MARPNKIGLDYFPFDIVLDSKFELIEAEFGLTGFAVVVKLLQCVYQNGYYCEWNKEVALLFSKKNGFFDGGKVVEEILRASIRRSIFNQDLYEKYGVLTSRDIQNTYFEAVNRRKEIFVDLNILLVDVAKICPKSNINDVNVDINLNIANENTQSKVKESKVNKSKVKESKEIEKTSFLAPSLSDIEKYINEKCIKVDGKYFYDYFTEGNWFDSKGNKVKNWKQKLLTWSKYNQKEEQRNFRQSTNDKNLKPSSIRTGELADWEIDVIKEMEKMKL